MKLPSSGWIILCLVFWGACAGGSLGQQPALPLYEQEAYDLITLSPQHDNAVLKVLPLNLPGRRVPQPLPKTGNLQFRLVDEPDVIYEVPWASVAKVELFHDLILAEGRRLAENERFAEAYDYLNYLQENDAELPGLREVFLSTLFREGRKYQAEGKYDLATAVFLSLHERDRSFPGLPEALGETLQERFKSYVTQADFWSARRTLRTLTRLYPQHELLPQWQDQLVRIAESRLAEAKQSVAAGDFSAGHRLVRQALEIWPQLKEALQFARELQRQYPRVVVSVTEPLYQFKPTAMHHWPSRRLTRLVGRNLFEFAGPSPEGGRYVGPFVEARWDQPSWQLTLKLRPGIRESEKGGELSAAQIASQLIKLGDAESAVFGPVWARLRPQVECPDLGTVLVRFSSPPLRPEALLTMPIYPSRAGSVVSEFETASVAHTSPEPSANANAQISASSARLSANNAWKLSESMVSPSLGQGNGANRSHDYSLGLDSSGILGLQPYKVAGLTNEGITFVFNNDYFAHTSSQPKEIVEQYFDDPASAIQALRQGRVDLIDRIPPWHLGQIRNVTDLVVEPYGLPMLHLVIPNTKHRLVERPAFRRGLVYALDREAILSRLLGGTRIPGCQVISGPFLPGLSHDDPLSYAYDQGIEPRPYDPRLAIALLQVAFAEWTSGLPQEERPERFPELVLAHPPNPIARASCESIALQLKRVGLTVRLQPLETIVDRGIPEEIHLLYVEFPIWEPSLDIYRLLGETGIAGYASPYLRQLLYQLQAAKDWAETAGLLRRIHRLAFLETSVIPLFQILDFSVRHQSMQGFSSRPLTLYQHVENWQLTPRDLAFEF